MDEIQEEMKCRLQKALDAKEKIPADLAKDLNIPKSAISQYLSGKSKKMPPERIYAISKYLGVNEAWLMGYDVQMERFPDQQQTDQIVDVTDRIRNDKEFRNLVLQLDKLNSLQLEAIKNVIAAFPSE